MRDQYHNNLDDDDEKDKDGDDDDAEDQVEEGKEGEGDKASDDAVGDANVQHGVLHLHTIASTQYLPSYCIIIYLHCPRLPLLGGTTRW